MLPTEKRALVERLARLAATDIPNTPRLLMRHRSPGELAGIQQGVTSAIGRVTAPIKKTLNTPIPGTPEILPEKMRGAVRKGTDFAIDNPETLLGMGLPVPGALALLHAGKRGLEKSIDKAWPMAQPAQSVGRLMPGAPGLAKAAAGAPTRGNFMMASDVPPFKAPRLDRAIQKDGAYESEPYTSIFKGAKLVKLEGDAIIECDKQGKSLGKGNLLKEKDSDALPDGLALQPWDNFKRSKYAMPTEKLAEFVEGLRKEAIPGLTPQSRLEQSTRIGAPRATPPPGPSIAMQSKPTGFGTPIAGAQKGSIGGGSFATSGMKPPPQIGMG
jgi:hypothetical protein